MAGSKELMGGPPRLHRRWKAALPDNAVAFAWSPDARRLAAALASGPVLVFDIASGKPALELAGHGFGTMAVSWKPDGTRLATAGQDGKARLWDAATGKELAALDAGAPWAEHAAWHPSEPLLATAAGKRLRLWSADGELRRDWPHPSTISALAWRPGTGEPTTGFYGGVRVWALDRDEPAAQAEWKGAVASLAWKRDGSRLAHGDQGGTMHLWTPATGDHLEMAGYPRTVRNVSWDASGTYLATDGSEFVLVWDCKPPGPEKTEPLQLKAHAGAVTAAAWHPRHSLLVSGGEDGKVHLWQPLRYRKPLATSDLGGAVLLAWEPLGQLLAASNDAGSLVVYSM
ncbi:MAG: WD40 repeat domain-containing protein [Gemmataceae bacterium]|nr:WD40 repeat domain-containing protein [Gemmataceae bacterium]